ncbi:MAG: LPXTG cell wall anchor domain-containing protein, partial [Patescibacteria group bacterium]
SFQQSKSAYNQTQGVAAQSVQANPGDIINYTLTYQNTGSVNLTNVVITDDLSGILPYADVINAGDGSLSGNTITYPAISVPAGVSISKTFQVKVRDVSASSGILTMTNTYGNQVSVQIRPPTVKGASIPPKTGPAENFALIFAGALTGGLYVFKKVRQLKTR